MGDYLKNGAKIGTCGKGYYTTKKMLEDMNPFHLGEGTFYLDPKNNCSFVFPFPEFDHKKAGDISIFHKPDEDQFQIKIKLENSHTHHKDLVFHMQPSGSQGVNFFCKCPYHPEAETSKFTEEYAKFHLKYQHYINGEIAIAGDCIFCGQTNIFDKEEAEEAAKILQEEADWIMKDKNVSDNMVKVSELKYEVAKRIIATYK